ncbi:hypothetical protein MIPYR_20150 [uncultured Microbacterium sp.]|uniref:Uncharacterized protein n=1 Tax=uncultured Microbacterium sp. TaxID=191216 RepID=A0A1Y5P6V6_9MICO|nr:hypothetical protein MIPYR_20150 [uncultured Microbacterium sp.]
MPLGAEEVGVVREDHVGLGDDVGDPGEPLDGVVHIVDAQVQQGGRGVPVQEEPCALELEEQQTRRVEAGHRRLPEQHRVEVGGAVEIIGVLGDLDEVHGRPFLRGAAIARATASL